MCFVLFAASPEELPLVAWNPRRRGFHVTKPSRPERQVSVQFSYRNVYYLGSHIRCGCGFRRTPWVSSPFIDVPEGTPDEINATHRELARWVRSALDDVPELELFGCWWGEFSKRAARVTKLHWSELYRGTFAFRERELLRVHRWLPRC